MKKIRQVLRVVFLASIFIFPLIGCSVESDRTDKPSDDRSRGLLLGMTDTKQPVALQVDAHKHVHLVWCEIVDDDRERALQYARLNEQGQILVNAPLGIDLPNPRKAQLLVDGDGNLHLAWLSRTEGRQRLYHVLIDRDGQATPNPNAPLLLSREGEDVDSFRMYTSAKGEMAFIWSSQMEAENERGIFHLVLPDASPNLLVSNGVDPYVLVDNSGTPHLIWLYEKGLLSKEIYYATVEGAHLAPDGGQKLTSFELPGGAVHYGPVIGADAHNLYVIWTVQSMRGGLTPNTAHAFYVSFEPGKPSVTRPNSIGLPTEYTPEEYTDYDDSSSYEKLILLSPWIESGDFANTEQVWARSSDFVNAAAVAQTQGNELPVAFSLAMQSPSQKSTLQIAMLVFSERQPIGYQLASNTSNASVVSTLAVDSDSDLHIAWIDTAGFRQYDVYYASTSTKAKRWLDRTSSDDIVLGAADLLWGIISGIGLLPIAAIWNFPPIMWVVLFYIFSGREYLDRMGTKIGLLVSIVIYVASKLFLLPGLSMGTPFLYQAPRAMIPIIALTIPSLILLAALGAIYIYVRRSERATIFKAYLVFALVDGITTVVLYAPGFFNPS